METRTHKKMGPYPKALCVGKIKKSKMEKIFKFFGALLFVSILLVSCKLSTDELAKEVEKNMI